MSQQAFPTAATPAVEQRSGGWYFTNPWIIWLAQFAAQPGALVPITPTASPFSYTAPGSGSLAINGGTVSARTLTRAGSTAPIGASLIPMANGDVATITYSVAPTLSFIPG